MQKAAHCWAAFLFQILSKDNRHSKLMLKYTKEFIEMWDLKCKRIYRMSSILNFWGFWKLFGKKSLRLWKKYLHSCDDTALVKEFTLLDVRIEAAKLRIMRIKAYSFAFAKRFPRGSRSELPMWLQLKGQSLPTGIQNGSTYLGERREWSTPPLRATLK